MRRILIVLLILVNLTACSNEQAVSVSDSSEETSSQTVSEETSGVEINSQTDKEASEVAEESNEENTNSNDFYGDLSIDGKNLVDSDGNIVQLKGISTHGINWFPDYVNSDMFVQIKEETNSNLIRLAMYTEDYDGYVVSDESVRSKLETLIDQGVNYAVENDMYVIIDWHILNDNNPLTNVDAAIEFFGKMSKKYGNIDNVIFEICNEPNGETTWDDITEYANQVIPVIRENSDNIIVVGTPNWSQDVDIAAASPLDYENIMYTLHFYSATHKQELRDKLQIAIDSDLPVFVTEFGVSDSTGNGDIDLDEADTWLDMLDENNISYSMWNLSNKDESSSMIKSDVTKTSDLSYDDLTDAGKWYIDRLTGSTSDKNTTSNEEEKTEQATTGEVSATSSIVDQWEGGFKFDSSITNETSNTVKNWTIKITFESDITVSDNWNCEAQVDGNTLTLTPVDYNSEITSGNSQGDIGYIIDAQTEPIVSSVEVL